MGLAIGAIKDLQKHSLILLIFFVKLKLWQKKWKKLYLPNIQKLSTEMFGKSVTFIQI